MEIILSVTARGSDARWDDLRVDKEIMVKTEVEAVSLPWAQICANLVESAIAEYKATTEATKAAD